MKTLLPLIAACLLLAGCATTPQSTQQRVQSAANVASYVGSSEYLRAHPETRPAFVHASASLAVLEQSEHVDLATLLAIVQQLPVKELKNDRAQLIVTAATILLSDYAGSLPVEQLDNLKPVAKAIREGIDLALAGEPKSAFIQPQVSYGCTVAGCKEHGTPGGFITPSADYFNLPSQPLRMFGCHKSDCQECKDAFTRMTYVGN